MALNNHTTLITFLLGLLSCRRLPTFFEVTWSPKSQPAKTKVLSLIFSKIRLNSTSLRMLVRVESQSTEKLENKTNQIKTFKPKPRKLDIYRGHHARGAYELWSHCIRKKRFSTKNYSIYYSFFDVESHKNLLDSGGTGYCSVWETCVYHLMSNGW